MNYILPSVWFPAGRSAEVVSRRSEGGLESSQNLHRNPFASNAQLAFLRIDGKNGLLFGRRMSESVNNAETSSIGRQLKDSSRYDCNTKE
jgi:hypothetical protein